MKLFKL